MTQAQQQSAANVLGALSGQHFPAMLVPILLAQAAFETNYFQSNAFLQDNNATGIKWINKPYQDATRGIKSSEKDNYAHFANLNAWAKDFKRIISLNLHGAGRPIDATTIGDYVHRLKINGYFGSPEAQYLAGIKRVMLAIQYLQDAASERQGTALATNYETPHPLLPASMSDAFKDLTGTNTGKLILLGLGIFILAKIL